MPEKSPHPAVHPFIRFALGEARKKSKTVVSVAKMAGIDASLISHWKRGSCSPTLANIEAVLNALGYELILRKVAK
ncbi:helix-turn-helix domain-containing protein [Methylocystis heyeri]|uniref:Helix-turn-helix domain-containing protein n=1 Tax=Methylocystis heyeri TaxID=391905 RepID=A0A6B8KGN5_9HYPH|nr:helix-turn-helix domain-containing protein [Methylocystis heyeri]